MHQQIKIVHFMPHQSHYNNIICKFFMCSFHRPSSTMAQTVSPILSVLPTRGLVDEKFKVALENLPPRFPVTLHSLHQSEDKDYWEAFGYYVSDDRGRVTGRFRSSSTRT